MTSKSWDTIEGSEVPIEPSEPSPASHTPEELAELEREAPTRTREDQDDEAYEQRSGIMEAAAAHWHSDDPYVCLARAMAEIAELRGTDTRRALMTQATNPDHSLRIQALASLHVGEQVSLLIETVAAGLDEVRAAIENKK